MDLIFKNNGFFVNENSNNLNFFSYQGIKSIKKIHFNRMLSTDVYFTVEQLIIPKNQIFGLKWWEFKIEFLDKTNILLGINNYLIKNKYIKNPKKHWWNSEFIENPEFKQWFHDDKEKDMQILFQNLNNVRNKLIKNFNNWKRI